MKGWNWNMYGNNYVAFLTAFDSDGSVKVSACEKMVDFYLGQGADGLYLHGFTGEGWCMTPEMRKTWIKRTVDVVDHRVPVFVSVGYGKTEEEGIELARYAGAVGADAVSSVAIRPEASIEENVAYFKKVSEAAKVLFYVYWHMANGNLNGGARLDAEELIDILKREVPTFAGFKYTDSNFYYAQRIKQYAPEVKLFTGVDQMCVAGHLMGSDGSIGALQAATCGHYSSMLSYTLCRGIREGWLERGQYEPIAKKLRNAALACVDEYGIVRGVCGAPTFDKPGSAPEGQAFLLMMEHQWALLMGE